MQTMETPSHHNFWSAPLTRAGKLAAILGAVFIFMFITNAAVLQQFQALTYVSHPWLKAWLIPGFVITMLLCGLASGIFGGIAIFYKRERSVFTWVGFVLGILLVFLLMSEASQLIRHLSAGN